MSPLKKQKLNKIRLELDKQYKCSLQSEEYKNKECS